LKRQKGQKEQIGNKISKPQNENICLTNLNVENNGNFPILAFGVVSLTD
jgi:hypothetical protein